MGLRGALGRRYPGADIHLEGAVPAGAVASVHCPRPAKAGREGKHTDGRRGSIHLLLSALVAATPTYTRGRVG